MNIQSKIADCETCDKTDVEVKAYIPNMFQCEACHQLDVVHQTPQAQSERVDTYRATVIEKSKVIDASIVVKSDIFNAKTIAIVELKKAIDADDSIENKPFALASSLKDRFTHIKSVVFDLNEKLMDANNEITAIQVYLNNLANQLRVEEREKLKISDINYKPNVVTSRVKSIKTTGTSIKKASKAEIKTAAQQLGINEFTLAAFVLQSGGNLEAAVTKIKASLEAAKKGN